MAVEVTFTKDSCYDTCKYKIIQLRKKNEPNQPLKPLEDVNINVEENGYSDKCYANIHGIFLND